MSGNTYLRNQGSAVSVLDLVLTDSPQIGNKFSLENAVGSSSHARVAVTLCFSPTIHKSYNKISWQYHRADWEGMCQFFESTEWCSSRDVNERWSSIKHCILQSMDKFIPKREI